MLIRDATAHDAAEIHALLTPNGWAHRIGDAVELSELLEASQRKAVAVDGGKIVGFLRAITDERSNGYLSMLVVAPEARRKGVATALLRHVVGPDTGITWLVRAERKGAQELFSKLGFVASTAAMERRRRTG